MKTNPLLFIRVFTGILAIFSGSLVYGETRSPFELDMYFTPRIANPTIEPREQDINSVRGAMVTEDEMFSDLNHIRNIENLDFEAENRDADSNPLSIPPLRRSLALGGENIMPQNTNLNEVTNFDELERQAVSHSSSFEEREALVNCALILNLSFFANEQVQELLNGYDNVPFNTAVTTVIFSGEVTEEIKNIIFDKFPNANVVYILSFLKILKTV